MSLTVTSREQVIDNYKLLLKKKKDLTRKNRAVQTKIAQYVRKNKIDLEGINFNDSKVFNNLIFSIYVCLIFVFYFPFLKYV